MPGKKKKNFKQGKNLCTFKLTSDGSVFFKNEESQRIAEKLSIIPGEDEEIANSHLMDSESRRRVQEKYNVFAADDDDYNYLQHLRRRRKEPEQETENADNIIRPNADAVLHVITGKKVTTVVLPSETQNAEEANDDLKEVLAALESDKEISDDDEDDNFFDNLLKPSVAEKNSVTKRKVYFDDFNEDHGDTEDFDEGEELDEDFDEDACEEESDLDGDDIPPGPREMKSHGIKSPSDMSGASVSSVEHRYRNMKLDDDSERNVEKIWSKAFDDLGEGLSEDFDEDDMTKDIETAHRVLKEDEDKNQTVFMKDFIEKPMDKDRIMNRFEYQSNSSDEEMVEIVKTVDPLEGFDCESVISSRATNRTFTPKIVEILPLKSKRKKTNKKERSEEDSDISSVNTSSQKKITKISVKDPELESNKPVAVTRCKNETAEEKKARKLSVKEKQRERREEKSERKKLFSQEVQRRKEENLKTAQMRTSTRIE